MSEDFPSKFYSRKPPFLHDMEVILTSHRYGERELLEELKELGDFYQTGLKDVIRGARALFLKLLRDGVGLE